MDIPRPNPLGTATALATAEVRKTLPATKVAESAGTGPALAEDRRPPGQDRAVAEVRDIAALRLAVERRTLSAGPPPAFRISILEAGRGIEQTLARIEAMRAQAEQDSFPGTPQATAIGVPGEASAEIPGPSAAPSPEVPTDLPPASVPRADG